MSGIQKEEWLLLKNCTLSTGIQKSNSFRSFLDHDFKIPRNIGHQRHGLIGGGIVEIDNPGFDFPGLFNGAKKLNSSGSSVSIV